MLNYYYFFSSKGGGGQLLLLFFFSGGGGRATIMISNNMAEKAPGDYFKGRKGPGWQQKAPGNLNLVAEKAPATNLMAETAPRD